MKRVMWFLALVVALGAVLLPMATAWAQAKTPAELRKAFSDGNYKQAYDGLAPLVLAAPGTDKLEEDFRTCTQALNNLGRTDEIDDFREKAIAAHAQDWRLLLAAAQSYRDEQHYGTIISGAFHRGSNRNGDGKWVSAAERDRVRSLQLMDQGVTLLKAQTPPPPVSEAAQFYYQFATMLLQSNYGEDAWRLQTLTDLTKLPDYDPTQSPWYWNQQQRGAPVDDQGNPIFHQIPKGGWETATTDGQRWRWALLQASELSPTEADNAKLMLADFLNGQFGVQTMAGYVGRLGMPDDDGKKNESGPYAVYTLKDDETIARLATGIRRFNLPDEFNAIKLYESVASRSSRAMESLAAIYADHQQFDAAAGWWKKDIAQFGPGSDDYRQKALDQIVGNWGMFENTLTQPAGDKGAQVDFRFRNAAKVSFTAQEIDIPSLLTDLKSYLKSAPNELNWDQLNIDNLGYRLITRDQPKYIGKQVAAWGMDLQPRADHFDKRINVETPLKKAGAYLLSAQIAGGNTTRIIVWISDTAIVQKPTVDKAFTFVADAVTGKPIANASVNFFGYRQVWIQDRRYRVDTQEFTGKTDDQGICTTDMADSIANDAPLPPLDPAHPVVRNGLNWMAIATTADGRMAFTGFAGIWAPMWHGILQDGFEAQYNQVKAFIMTDRPVYRPDQKVHFKMWLGENKYDQDGKNPWAGKHIYADIRNPRGEVVKTYEGDLDAFGGIEGELALDHNAALGTYSVIHWVDPERKRQSFGSTQFRVEEYKKPEFEVKVDAPSEPVSLGDKVTATISAKYYFGSPVTNAKVHYKITRSAYDARWYPAGRWDWFYEPGYWWFAADYFWYPGFRTWGISRPLHAWWNRGWSVEQPEVVSEAEVPVGADGTVKVEFDTAVAKAAYGDQDHKYTISAEVTDASRRTIEGSGDVLVARQPFKVYAWVDRGFYSVGETAHAYFNAQTLDNKPVAGKGVLKLFKISYDAAAKPTETPVQQWDLDTKADGTADVQIVAKEAGQYRLSYSVTDAKGRVIEGGYMFVVRGEGFDGKAFRFNAVELTTDKKEYAAGEKVHLMLSTDQENATVLLFVRPSNGVYLPPKVIAMKGKSMVEELEVGKKDMPNFFVEALTVSGAKVHTDVREVIVPPEDRILNVAVTADSAEYKPGQQAHLTVKLTEKNGEPFTGAAVLSLYDKAVEYISGGGNVRDIREYFWKWRRQHNVNGSSSLDRGSGQALKEGEIGMAYLGVFGVMAADYGLRTRQGKGRLGLEDKESFDRDGLAFNSIDATARLSKGIGGAVGGRGGGFGGGAGGGRFAQERASDFRSMDALAPAASSPSPAMPAPGVEPAVRSNFADTALWAPKLITASNGTATVDVTMPENLTTWKARVWAFGNGSRVGQGDTEVITRKNLIVRLEAPRFFVQNDEVIISAIVHNYLKSEKLAKVSIELVGDALTGPILGSNNWGGALPTMETQIKPNGEQRVNWLVKVSKEGTATIRIKAITDEESDATQMSFPVYVHGMLKTNSFAGALRPNPIDDKGTVSSLVKLTVPKQRRPEQTLLEVQYSPSLASAMVDALPYMADYPYGCTEQTLNRFVPTVITQKVLLDMHLDLADIQKKRTNLNAQELGAPALRAAQWKRFPDNPVFDTAEVQSMVRAGITKLANMQLGDGGWGWFSGYGEQSYPHTTATVIHGLQIAKDNGAAVDADVLERGVQWLIRDQAKRLAWIQEKRAERKAEDMDAFAYMVLTDAGHDNLPMREIIYEDRNVLSVYSKAMFGLAMLKLKDQDKLAMMLENCTQYLVEDDENQTAYLKVPPQSWWYWYGSENEADAYYLKLLAHTDPKGQPASRLAKYLLNNRKNGTYWTSTRDTALCIEALADYIRASGEDKPDMTVNLVLDGKPVKTEHITAENLFTFDNRFAIGGTDLTDGDHALQISRTGSGPLYYNAYLTNFTLEDHITRAGLEVRVNRKVYLLTRDDKTIQAQGEHGQAVDKRIEKYTRTELSDGKPLHSGDLVEVELTIDSKNDYEYILIEDMKAAGFEPVEVRSGYDGNDMNAYVEFRDERVAFFVRALGRGTHSVSYRLRAQVPGAFSALPAKISAMYAPELKGNSEEIRLRIFEGPLF